jgi:hypothetical protein
LQARLTPNSTIFCKTDIGDLHLRDVRWQRAADRCCRAVISVAWMREILARTSTRSKLLLLLHRVAALFERDRQRAKAEVQRLIVSE